MADLCLVDRANLASLVVAAVRAHVVRRLRFLTLRDRCPTGPAFSASWVRRFAVRVLECRRLGLGISILLLTVQQPLQGRQPGIFPLGACTRTWRDSDWCRNSGHSPRQSSLHNGFIGSAS